MKTVHISASHSYDVEIGSGLLPTLGEKAAALVKGRSACIVSDDTVFALYGETAKASLEGSGFRVVSYVFPHGEESKNGSTFLDLLNFLAENHLTRADALIALGGGVTGDMTGFAAACFLRGVAYIQVPTTLLAMVDSSVGGKTAIDLPAGKNLAGAFYQPRLVLCDTDCLATLPQDIFCDGCAEVIKYAVLYSRDLFENLKAAPAREQLEYVISTCVAMKRDVVAQDEFDTGARQFLNLGHTMGHAVEAGSHFTLSHGKSVAIGTAMVARAACKKGFCNADTVAEIEALLTAYSLPTVTDQSVDSLFASALGDKKRQGGTITLVVPQKIGSCVLLKQPVENLREWIALGCEEL